MGFLSYTALHWQVSCPFKTKLISGNLQPFVSICSVSAAIPVNSRSKKAISTLISLQRVPLSLPGLSLQENHVHFPLIRLQNVQSSTSPSQSCSLPANSSFLVCFNVAEKTSHHLTSSGSLTICLMNKSLKWNPSNVITV